MQKNQTIKLAVAVILLLGTAGLLLSRGSGRNRMQGAPMPDYHYYYDVQADALFEAAADQIPPIVAPSGGEGVRAFVYTCSDCTDDAQTIGYLQKYHEQAIELVRSSDGLEEDFVANQRIQSGTLVASKPQSGTSPQWVSLAQPQGQTITQAYLKICDGKLARICHPKPDQTQ